MFASLFKPLFHLLVGFWLAGCASPPVFSPQVTLPQSTGRLTQDKRHDVVMQSMAMLDRGYTYGGKKLHTGFDCSGLVSFVYKNAAGLDLRGSSADMAAKTRPIQSQAAMPGDLVFFNTRGAAFSHVGIYIGSGKFIHAANERTGVKQERLDSTYWAKRFEGFRVLD
ncbi:MAG: NlpC/P60 family protein [Limnohabitans sp.]